ncbi:uncharacterized protein LOC132904390 [Amyelois transitella]|uniref:uncharacterized protein LOC132904390 n=1 Tax=Amyelois transitella TaxID=680683 RepID=UPI0029904666|nr:uncharacterized protein LOC132904390 [Amyelois transitella]
MCYYYYPAGRSVESGRAEAAMNVTNADKDKVVSDENYDTFRDDKILKTERSIDDIPKRFLEDMSDYEWHIAHLKDKELASGRRHCKETFEDRVKKYKKMLANDASRIEFVSADALQVDEKDLIPEKCEEIDEGTSKSMNSTSGMNLTTTDSVDNERLEVTNSATTAKIKGKKGRAKTKKKKMDDGQRRASEYLFSSVEYYDEVPDFDGTVCPDAVEVIKLEMDSIRPYDVDCELMLQWHSLR